MRGIHICLQLTHRCPPRVRVRVVCRVWNIDCDCLGEMPLPNLSEGMKRAPFDKRPEGGWKFVLERLTVTEEQKEMADTLRDKILAAKKGLTGAALVASTLTGLKLPATTGALVTASDSVMSLPLITPSWTYLPSPKLFDGHAGEGSDSDADSDEEEGKDGARDRQEPRLGGRLEETRMSMTLHDKDKSGNDGAAAAVSFAVPSPKVPMNFTG